MKQKQIPTTNQSSLSKFIAQAGVCARRKAVDLIKEGLVTVNNITVHEPGFKLNATDLVTVRAIPIKQPQKVYILLNKPKDCITTSSDERGRKTVMDLFKNQLSERIYPVGRLDRNTTGVLLLTNDGELAEQLAHPRNEIAKTYNVKLNRSLAPGDLLRIKEGVRLEDGVAQIDYINYLQKRSELIVELHCGKNRIIRRLFEELGYEVIKLDRAAYAGVTKQKLLSGQWRHLFHDEIQQLKKCILQK
jgi:23S rRNA pseudouridine2605 synthase